MQNNKEIKIGRIYYSALDDEYVIPVEKYEHPDTRSGVCYAIQEIGKYPRERYIESTLFFQHYTLVE